MLTVAVVLALLLGFVGLLAGLYGFATANDTRDTLGRIRHEMRSRERRELRRKLEEQGRETSQ